MNCEKYILLSSIKLSQVGRHSITYVEPGNTSKKCSSCGSMGIREGKSFKCGQVDHADFNSSFNIALRPPLMEGIGQLHTDRDVCKGSTDTPEGQLQERWRPQNLRSFSEDSMSDS